VEIGNNVFIGYRTVIIAKGNLKIGDNVVIGACAVITKSIDKNETWAGNPARRIKVIDKTRKVIEKSQKDVVKN